MKVRIARRMDLDDVGVVQALEDGDLVPEARHLPRAVACAAKFAGLRPPVPLNEVKHINILRGRGEWLTSNKLSSHWGALLQGRLVYLHSSTSLSKLNRNFQRGGIMRTVPKPPAPSFQSLPWVSLTMRTSLGAICHPSSPSVSIDLPAGK